MKTKPREPLWWLRFKICFNIFFTRLLRIIFELTVLLVWLLYLIPMLFSNKFFKRRAKYFFMELSDFSKPRNHE